ncbi:MAG TPA: PorP/SprF family type IX secretion system membrane protein [Bacteroidia bacterium]|nr:PorP/SprF family type IX secretion system membrane protein [Bacteroidia bacterium]
MKKFFPFAVLLLAISAKAQDIHFSQFYMSPLTLNPALTGAQHDMQVNLNYKDQWQSVTNPFRTSAVSFDMRTGKNKKSKGFLAFGANIFNDNAGDGKIATTQGNLSLAYHARIDDNNTFGGGLQAGFAQRSMNGGSLQWGTQFNGFNYDSSLPAQEPSGASSSFSYADFGAGLDWNHDNISGARNVTNNHDEKFNFGVSVFHLNRPAYSFYGTGEKLYMRFVAHGSAILSLPNSNVAFVPGFMYARQGPQQEIYAGTLIRYVLGMDSKYTGFKQGAALSIGGFLRARDAIAVVTMLEFSHYSVGFSYDVNVSPLRTASSSRGGFEIALRFVSPNPFQPSGSSRMID